MTSSTEARRRRRLPDFFIVGHPKCGTTALYEMLRRHPQIYMPALKEPRFFADDLRARFQPRTPTPDQPKFPETLEEYLALFDTAAPDQRVGEASPSYLMSRVAAEQIARLVPDARIIALLREPTDFLRSLQLELIQNHIEIEQDFRRAMANEELPPLPGEAAERRAPARRYSDRIRYVEQLSRYHSAFPAAQVLVLIYDDFRDDNEGTVRQVLRFLGVDDTGPVHTMRANPTVRVRSMRADRLVRSLYAAQGPVSGAAKSAIKALTPRSVHGEGFEEIRRRILYSAPTPPDEAFTQELRSRFKAEVIQLSDYLGRDFVTLWGYDRID